MAMALKRCLKNCRPGRFSCRVSKLGSATGNIHGVILLFAECSPLLVWIRAGRQRATTDGATVNFGQFKCPSDVPHHLHGLRAVGL
jgi:hypothetical protein